MKNCSIRPLDPNQSWCLLKRILFLALLLVLVAQTTPETAAQLPVLSIEDATKLEGDSGTAPMIFTVTLSAPTGSIVTVRYDTTDATAMGGDGDYIPVPTSPPSFLVFQPGETVKTINIPILGDKKVEPDEKFFLNLSNPNGATLSGGGFRAVALGTIFDDDAAPKLSFNNVSITEGNNGTTNAAFSVQRSGNLGQPLTLNYSTSDGTAVAGSDYVTTSGTLAFAPGETTKTINVPVIGDLNIEGNETFFVNLSTASSPNLATLKGTIVNDDGIPLVSISDASILEGNTGTSLLFAVSLSASSALPVTVSYSTTDGTAVAGSDYVAITNGTLTIPAFQLSATITVPIIGDTLTEPDETFFVNLTNANNAAIGRDKATGTIRNDDTTATLSIGNAVVPEGNSGTTPMFFTVTLSGSSGQPVTVDYATSDGTATGNSDYVPAGGRLTFLPGQLSQTISVTINGDGVYEPDEDFFVTLSNPTGGATLANSQARGTIQNDDSPPTLSISGAIVKEGDSGTVNATFTVTLTGASQPPVTVDFFTSSLTAAADVDFVSTSGTLTFPPGTSSRTVTVPVIGDNLPESDETFIVNLSNPVNATIVNAAGLGTIFDDDSGPSLSISDAVIVEGDSGTTPAVFTVTLSSPAIQQITVHVSTSDLTATGGTGFGFDYEPLVDDLLFQPGGPTNKTVTVFVNGDTVNEPDEFFYVNLSGEQNATVANRQGIGIIQNDDVRPTLSISDTTVNEGNGGTTTATFRVRLSGPAAQLISVDYFTQNGTATLADSDYVASSGTLFFFPGVLSQDVVVSVIGDTKEEPDESFVVNLINASSNARIEDPVGQGTILNDDLVPRLSIGDAPAVLEGDTGTVNAVFPLNLSVAAPSIVTIAYSTANGTATAGSDYVATTSGVAVFPAGTTSASITVPVNGDTTIEPDETFFVNLGQASGAQVIVANFQGKGTILNDDSPPAPGALSVSDALPVVEGNTGTKDAVFTVTLSKPSILPVTVNFATANGLATAGLDYIATNGVLSFAPGETNKTISVSVIGDTLVEGDEFFLLNLGQPQGATIDVDQALGLIRNDDVLANVPPTVRITSPANGATFTAPANITITSVATDSDGSIARVEFFRGIVKLGEATSSPYNFTLTNVAAGNYLLTAKATDNLGATTTSTPVSITVNPPPNLPPAVTITLPASGATFIAPTNILLTAVATDSDGSIARVEFFQDTTKVGEVTSSPYNFTLTNVATGNYTLTAKATDNLGATTTSTPVSIIVNPPLNLPPAVTITSPTNGATFIAPTNILIAAVATDSDGSIARVEFFQDNTKVGEATSSPYNFTLTNVAAGNYILTAIATDNRGATSISASVGILVNARTNSPPTVAITTPADGATFTAPTNILLTAVATDSDGSVAKVEFFQGTAKLGEATTSPYNFTLANVSAGNYILTAQATDNLGATSTSTPINIVVNARPNSPPTVAITSPANAATFNEPANIVIVALANDTDGSIAKVEFFQGNVKLGETTASPYSFNLSNVAAGNYALTARATDNLGATATSAPVDVVVKPTGNLPSALSIGDQAVTEGNSGTVSAIFNVSLFPSNSLPVTVDYFTASDTALAGSDFVATNGTLIFMPGDTNKTISVQVIGDTFAEDTEFFSVNLTNATNASISDGQGLGFITDDDSLPTLVITDTAVTEGDSGTTNAVFNVALSAISGQIVTVDFATANDTARAGSDYQPVSGTLTFNPGDTNKTIVVPVISDLIGEPDESFFVNLTNVINAVLTDSQAIGRITDNDSFPRLSIGSVSVTEGNSGNANAVFTVSLSAASSSPVSVNWATANGTATAPGDYLANSGTLTFAAGQTTRTLTVVVNGDTINEPAETFFVSLSNAVNAGISVGQGVATGTIVDDDLTPSLLITDAVVSEGNSGTTTKLVFQARLSTASGKIVSVDYATANGTATAGLDYQSANGTLTFPPGTILQTLAVTVIGDDLVEPDETVLVNLSNVANATVGRGQGVGKILDDDEFPSLTVTDASVSEGNSGTTNAVFTVLLSIASSQTVTVDFVTSDGTATAGSDYLAVSKTLSFPPGTTSTNVSVLVIGDTIEEPDEIFIVRLTNAVNATIARDQGQGAIRNDDNPNTPPTQPVLDIALTLDRLPVIQLEGQVGTSYVIEASTNLVNWITFTNVVATDALMRFPEFGASNLRTRYYRARQGP